MTPATMIASATEPVTSQTAVIRHKPRHENAVRKLTVRGVAAYEIVETRSIGEWDTPRYPRTQSNRREVR